MTTLLYRGNGYVQHKEQASKTECIELTYRREHYNTCRENYKINNSVQLAYRGNKYYK